MEKKFSWFWFWIAGWMFTLGYTEILLEFKSWWEQVIVSFLMYILWPLMLGIYL